MHKAKEVKGLVLSPDGAEVHTMLIQVTRDEKGTSISIGLDDEERMLMIPAESVDDLIKPVI